MSDPDPADLTLSEGYEIIGRFIAGFSDLDARLSEFVTIFFRMGETNEWADSIVHSIDCSRKCEAIKAFCQGLDAFRDIKKTVERIEKNSAARNIAAHGRLGRNPEGELYLQSYGAGKFLRVSKNSEIIKVYECLDHIEAISECRNLLDRHAGEMKALFELLKREGR